MRRVVAVLLLASFLAGSLRAQPERAWSDEELTRRLLEAPERQGWALEEARRRGLGEEVWGALVRTCQERGLPEPLTLDALEGLRETASERSLGLLLELLRRWGGRGQERLRELVRAGYDRVARGLSPEALEAALWEALPPGERDALGRLEEEARARPDDPLLDLALVVRATQGGDPVMRAVAARLLGRQRGGKAAQMLAPGLRTRNVAVVEALGELGSLEAAPLLVPLLRARSDAFSDPAARALARLGPGVLDRVGRVPGLARLLGELGPDALPLLLEELRQPDPEARLAAASELARAPDPGALDALAAALEDPHRPVRAGAAEALCRLGVRAAPAAPALVRYLQAAPDDAGRLEAAAALAAIGSAARGVPGLSGELLAQPDPILRYAAARALASVDPDQDPDGVALSLSAALATPRLDLQQLALDGLCALGPRAAPVAGELLGLVARVGPSTPGGAARRREQLLRTLCAQGEPAFSVASEGLADPDPLVRCAATDVLGELAATTSANQVVEALLPALADPDSEVRGGVLVALDAAAERVEWPEERAPALVAAIDSAHQGRPPRAGLRLLARLGPEGWGALERALERLPAEQRGPGLEALGRAGGAERVLPLLSGQLREPGTAGRAAGFAVVSALARELPPEFLVEAALLDPAGVDLTAAASRVLPLLVAAAREGASRARRSAFQALVRLGTAGALVVLERAASSEDGRELRDAWGALHAVRGQLDPALVAAALMRARGRERSLPLLQLLGPSDSEGAVLAAAVLEALARTEVDPGVAPAAAQMLGRLGPVGRPALIRLLRAAQAGDPVHHAATQALKEAATGAPDLLLPLLRDPAPGARAAGFASLAEVAARTPWSELAVGVVVAGMDDQAAPVREACVGGIGRLRAIAPHTARVAVLVSDPDPAVRLAATQALSSVGPVDEPSRTALRAALQDETLVAAAGRGLRGSRAGQELLREVLRSPDPRARLRVAEMMGEEGAVAAGELLASEEPELRAAALTTLERLGRVAGAATEPLLRTLATDADAGMRAGAGRVLAAARVEEKHHPALVQALQDPDVAVRVAVTRALAFSLSRGGGSDVAVQGLLQATRDPEVEVRMGAVGALGRVRDRPEVQEELLRLHAQDPDNMVREAARRLLPRPR